MVHPILILGMWGSGKHMQNLHLYLFKLYNGLQNVNDV